jgi:hypothetical protein
MVLAAPGPLLTPPPSSSPPKTPHWSFPYASTFFTHSHTLSLDSFCRPTVCKSSSPAGLFPLVYAYVVDCASASPNAYSSSTHRCPDDRTSIEATPLSVTSAELGLGLGLGLGLDSLSHFSSHALPFFSPPSFHKLSLSSAFTIAWWSDYLYTLYENDVDKVLLKPAARPSVDSSK